METKQTKWVKKSTSQFHARASYCDVIILQIDSIALRAPE